MSKSALFQMYLKMLHIMIFTGITLHGFASTGTWRSTVTGKDIAYQIIEAKSPLKDVHGNFTTIVYLQNLGFQKLGKNSNSEDINWLSAQGYRVITLDYAKHPKAVKTTINKDIIAINKALASRSFCDLNNCSVSQSYILFEGYRIKRNIPYFKDNPTVYNTPIQYTEGDTLKMDVIYPANSPNKIAVILSFSYSNSSATWDEKKSQLINDNKNLRTFLPYTFAGFNDTFLEGAPAHDFAWAIADHPKYCPWGSGKPKNGKNDTYKSFQDNPDTAQKIKSAIRTLRSLSDSLNLTGKIGVYGFSRGASAGAMAIGDKSVYEFEIAGFHLNTSDDVQAAALGPGVFDYTIIYNEKNDGDSNLETRCPWVWGDLQNNRHLWKTKGAAYLVESNKTAPVLFFYNTDDASYYQEQVAYLKTKLESLKIETDSLVNYGTGHAVPQTPDALNKLYIFFGKHLNSEEIQVNITPDQAYFTQGTDSVLAYQISEKSQNGAYKRSNYIHPLYSLNGTVLTEDFPEDHLHHRGIFWAWHQLYIDKKRIGDGWEIKNFSWEVTSVKAIPTTSSAKAIQAEIFWKSNLWLDSSGKPKPFVKENTSITVHPKNHNYRVIDIAISLTALEENITIGGSENDKGYGGFSARIKLPDDIIFTSSSGTQTPTNLPIEASNWMDISGSFEKENQRSGLTILCHKNNPGISNRWILRKKRSMQNAVYPFPGAQPVQLLKNTPTVLRYRLIVHDGDITTLNRSEIQKDYFQN